MNSVTAAVSGEGLRPSIRTRRTALIYDDVGEAGVSGSGTAVTDFADLSRDPEPVTVVGRIYSPANLVAVVTAELIAAAEPSAGVVTTYPAAYSDKQVALLRQALDLSGARDVLLVPEAVAATEWLEFERGPLESGFVLVYDLGGNSLDLAVARVGPDWTDHPIVGKPLRSHEFGGRPLGAIIARYARGATSDGLVSSVAPRDIENLRIAHIRKSFDLVRSCIRSSGRTLADIDHVLVVGGAARPAEVARTLTELGRPIVMSADPGQCCAAGAAHFAARMFAPADTGARAPRVAVFSSAAVASALAMSAATVFGGTGEQGPSPVLEIVPGAEALTENLLYDPQGESALDRVIRQGMPAALATTPARNSLVAPITSSATMGPSIAESGRTAHPDPRACCEHPRTGTLYADPAHFINPLPFTSLPTPGSTSGKPISWPAPPEIPRVSLPTSGENPDVPAAPGHSLPSAPGTGTGTSTSGGVGGSAPGGVAGETSGGATTPGGGTGGDETTGGATSSGTGGSSAGVGGGSKTDTPGGGESSGGASPHGGGSASGGSHGAGSGGAGSGTGASVGGSSPGASSAGTSHGGTAGGTNTGGSRPGTSVGGGIPGGGASPGGPSSHSSIGGAGGGHSSSSPGGSRGGMGGTGGMGGGMGGGPRGR
ncbi:hypothetical protein [Nocardia sp. NPDC005366]|uniref:hypothetical protein n=1 Tax=Nocardia sp. NPDC005366 TaxID=3156878 RepID=UPI0033A7953C